MRGDENATYEWKAPKNGGALWVIKKCYTAILNAEFFLLYYQYCSSLIPITFFPFFSI